MTKRFLFLLVAALFALALPAQTEKYTGRFYDEAIPISFSPGKSTFTDVRNTAKRPSPESYYYYYRYIPLGSTTYKYTGGKALYYKMELSHSGNVIIHNWNSTGVGYTSLFLLRPTKPGEEEDWAEGDLSLKWVASFEELGFLNPDFNMEELGIPPAYWGYAYLNVRNLPAGTYYVVTAGYKYSNASVPDGGLGITIMADLAFNIPSEPVVKPEEVNNCPVQYQYDLSGNRTKTTKKQ